MNRLLFLPCLLAYSTAIAQPGSADMQRAPVDAGELRYEVHGSGEPVLLIHGSIIAAAYVPLMDQPALSSKRLIRYHRRGMGGSSDPELPFSIAQQAADARDVLRHLGVQRAHIVGHSYGGAIALQFAVDYPEMLRTLVLLEPAGAIAFGNQPPAPSPPLAPLEQALAQYRAGDVEQAVDTFATFAMGEGWRAEAERLVSGSAEQAVKDARATFEVENPAIRQWRLRDEDVAGISVPLLLVAGSRSDASRWRASYESLQSVLPQTEYQIVDGVGHAMLGEDPQLVADTLASFFDRHSSR